MVILFFLNLIRGAKLVIKDINGHCKLYKFIAFDLQVYCIAMQEHCKLYKTCKK